MFPQVLQGPIRTVPRGPLLGQAASVTAPSGFTDEQLTDLATIIGTNPRLRTAADQAHGGRLTQELAGGPELLRRYEQTSPARAVLRAAMDARRLGHSLFLPEPLYTTPPPATSMRTNGTRSAAPPGSRPRWTNSPPNIGACPARWSSTSPAQVTLALPMRCTGLPTTLNNTPIQNAPALPAGCQHRKHRGDGAPCSASRSGR